jgi:hypothetical protein
LGCAVVAIGAVFGLGIAAAPALAAPEWGIEMTHANAYGLQADECPTGKEEDFPGEPARDCGVDPFTGSGTTFSRESGFNTYTIRVRNAGAASDSELLTCEPGVWEGEPTFEYQWLRNGVPIAGSTESIYSTTSADDGTAVQCEVTGTNEGGATVALTPSVLVPPAPSQTPPTINEEESGAAAHVEGEAAVGETLTCTPNVGAWEGAPTFSYQWLRDGSAITGATTSSYTLTAADEGKAMQCLLEGSNAGGATVGASNGRTVVSPSPGTAPPVRELSSARKIDVSASGSITGPVTVADRLPEGLVLAGKPETEIELPSGSGWVCSVASGARAFTCERSNPEQQLLAGKEYQPITVHVHVSADAPDVVANVASVAGGGVPVATAQDPTSITEAVPFGIKSFATSETNALGSPFTAAGGHPIAANATFLFNYSVNDSGSIETAGGTPKDVEAELPPGLIGNPQNASKCPLDLAQHVPQIACPLATAVGFVTPELSASPLAIKDGQPHPFGRQFVPLFELAPTPGHPAQFAFQYKTFFALDAALRSDGDYGLNLGDHATGRANGHGLLSLGVTFCSYGVLGEVPNHTSSEDELVGAGCASPTPGAAPFLTNPTQCSGAASTTTLRADTYQVPGSYVSKTVYNGTGVNGTDPSPTESFLTGCDGLRFNPEVQFGPSSSSAEGGTTQVDEPTGASFSLKVLQTNEAGVDATPELKAATVTLPEGMTVNPSAADGLQACSNAQFGLGSTVEPAEPATCPLASQVGTAKVITPLLEQPLEGQVFLGEPECSPCNAADAEAGRIFRLFLQVRSVERGVIVKLVGQVSANPTTGQLQARFTEQPQLPFSELLLTFNGGARAPLANPQTCGMFTTTSDLTPWSTSGLGGLSGSEPIAGTPDATPSSSFNVDWNGAGGACPASLPFGPSFGAGSQSSAAGAPSLFTMTFGREDREQDLSNIALSTPPGLLGKIAGIPQCPEAQANAGTCGSESEIGTTTVGAGPGPHPFYLGGEVYLTGPYKGEPFGLSIVTPAAAGPFNLGTVVVRAAIAVNPSTAALTITSDPLPQFVDGVQLRLRKINVAVNRTGFMLNPTNCSAQSVGATITAAQGASSSASTSFEVGGCSALGFTPRLTASTQAKTSKADGASLVVVVKSAVGQANIAKVDLQLPKQLPARDSTLNKACTEAQFDANPADCPEGSDIGTATASTPILNVPLKGPAYLVSHGGAAFPDVEFVLQGEGVTIVLDGKTDIKKGITYSRFESVPDAPISSFETDLSEGPHSIFGTDLPASANYSMCGQALSIPTIITGQNGKQIKQTTKIVVAGCKTAKSLTRAQKLVKALEQCRKRRDKKKRASCEARARKKYAPLKKATKSAKASGGRTGR